MYQCVYYLVVRMGNIPELLSSFQSSAENPLNPHSFDPLWHLQMKQGYGEKKKRKKIKRKIGWWAKWDGGERCERKEEYGRCQENLRTGRTTVFFNQHHSVVLFAPHGMPLCVGIFNTIFFLIFFSYFTCHSLTNFQLKYILYLRCRSANRLDCACCISVCQKKGVDLKRKMGKSHAEFFAWWPKVCRQSTRLQNIWHKVDSLDR